MKSLIGQFYHVQINKKRKRSKSHIQTTTLDTLEKILDEKRELSDTECSTAMVSSTRSTLSEWKVKPSILYFLNKGNLFIGGRFVFRGEIS